MTFSFLSVFCCFPRTYGFFPSPNCSVACVATFLPPPVVIGPRSFRYPPLIDPPPISFSAFQCNRATNSPLGRHPLSCTLNPSPNGLSILVNADYYRALLPFFTHRSSVIVSYVLLSFSCYKRISPQSPPPSPFDSRTPDFHWYVSPKLITNCPGRPPDP